MGGLVINTAILKEIVSNLKVEKSNFDKQQANVESVLDGIQWESESAVNYKKAITDLSSLMKELSSTVKNIEEHLESVANAYENFENSYK